MSVLDRNANAMLVIRAVSRSRMEAGLILHRMIHRAPMPIIIGSPRSGTTLLRFMLDAHPDLAIPPETGFLVPCAERAGQGTISREDFLHTLTRYPVEASGWQDFQISQDTFLPAL